MKTCCCTGHRPEKFPFDFHNEKKRKKYFKALTDKIIYVYEKYGITNFISGMARGVDINFAECVFYLREQKKYPIKLECAIPHLKQSEKWNFLDKMGYDCYMGFADVVHIVSRNYTPDCMFKRNRFMVDNSDVVIAVFNGIKQGGTWYTIKYAQQQNKIIEYIDLNSI